MNNWIFSLSEIENSYCLNDLVLPGTHNSCCTHVDSKIYLDKNNIYCHKNCCVNKIINNWAKNQNYDIYTQLNMGVRMFDIDISVHNNEFYTSHTFAIDKLEFLIEQLKEFNEKSGDLYILKIIHRYNITPEKIIELEKIFNTEFKNRIIYPHNYSEPLNIEINKFKQDGKNMLIYMENTNHKFYQTKYTLYSDWPNKQNAKECYDYNKLKLYNEFNVMRTERNDIFIDLNWTLTPTAKEIIYGLLCCCCFPITLESWVNKFNNKLNDFIEKNKRQLSIINSISIDFITEEIIENIIDINQDLLKKNNLVKKSK